MAKLGYTWYPKDWGNSESVFELSLSERGLYRELIDLAMLNDNTTEVKKEVWVRKFYVTIDELNFILCKLISLNLIEINDNILFIQSCESRLKLVRGGSKGGKNSKPTPKPTPKPFESLDEKNEKPTPKQIEKKEKGKERETKLNIEFDVFWNLYDKKVGSKEKLKGKWEKLKDDERQKIIETLPNSLNGIKDKQFQPHPETNLNNKRWEDEFTVQVKKPYTLYSPLGSNEFMLTEDELKEKKRTGYFKEAHEI